MSARAQFFQEFFVFLLECITFFALGYMFHENVIKKRATFARVQFSGSYVPQKRSEEKKEVPKIPVNFAWFFFSSVHVCEK